MAVHVKYKGPDTTFIDPPLGEVRHGETFQVLDRDADRFLRRDDCEKVEPPKPPDPPKPVEQKPAEKPVEKPVETPVEKPEEKPKG